jgi:hypothetical protein
VASTTGSACPPTGARARTVGGVAIDAGIAFGVAAFAFVFGFFGVAAFAFVFGFFRAVAFAFVFGFFRAVAFVFFVLIVLYSLF